MQSIIIVTLILLVTSFAHASNTFIECSITKGAYGDFFVERWNADEDTKYSVGYVAGDGKFIDKGFLSNVIQSENNLTAVIFAQDGSIFAYLSISDNEGIYYEAGTGPTSDSKGLNARFTVRNCKSPQR